MARSRSELFTASLIVWGLLAATAVAQSSGRWTTGAPMPSERTEVAVAEIGDKIYVLGGYRGELELEIYDPARDRWSRGAVIPRAVHHAAAVGLNNKIYLIGGYVDGWMPTDEVHEYDPASNAWRARARMPTPRGALAAAVIDGKIHAVGGNSWRDRNTGAHEVYDPDANRWSCAGGDPTPRDHLAVATVDGLLYAIGGRINGNYARNLDVNEVYDPRSDRWERLSAHSHGAQRDRSGGAARTHLRGRRRGADWHLPSGRGLRPQERPLERNLRPHADAAPRTGAPRSTPGTHLRHFSWWPDPRRLVLVGERDFHTVSLNGGNRRSGVERVSALSGSFSMVTEGGPTPEKGPTSALRIWASLQCSKWLPVECSPPLRPSRAPFRRCSVWRSSKGSATLQRS